ncbi:MAG: adenylosuccinate lyase [Micavibrio sp. TMED27]|nr:adenylosuccinate lyase [Micavibrio sp.]OUT91830.1 MAG: adenylosuccinate lyase [Micavibrio sp. TMED27]|tara:strand:- start:1004 stop:2317 length:1314 start_codon:yes stop_codon:yes gene_type:complete
MIPRYSRPEMANIFEQENKFRIWLEVETLALEKMAELGIVPESAAKALREKGNFDIARIDEIEAEVKHDVIAFLTSVAEFVGEESRFVHQGMTSSDVIDTSFAVQLTQAADIIIADLDKLLAALKKRSLEHKDTLCIGRSHGIHGEPTTFGMKLSGHYAAFKRAKERMIAAKEEISTITISGAVGTYPVLPPEVEAYVAAKLGLKPETVATQVIPRDRHAMFFATLGVIASSIENLAVEVRHLQRTEVREAEEYFDKNQKGSSAMPHKRNPIGTENMTGQARIIRSAVIPAMENVALWHERDISHSSVERTILPDALISADYALNRLAGIIDKLLVYPERMMHNLEMTGGLLFSQRVMLALTQAGISREDAYRIVQRNAMAVWEDRSTGKGSAMLRERLEQDSDVTEKLSADKLDEIFDYSAYTKNIGQILERALKD